MNNYSPSSLLRSLLTLKVLRHISIFLLRRPFGFTAFHATLSAQLQVLLLIPRGNSFGCFLAKLTRLQAPFLPAKTRYVTADLLHVRRLQNRTIRPHKKAQLPSHDTCFNVLDTHKNLFAELFAAYFQFCILLY